MKIIVNRMHQKPICVKIPALMVVNPIVLSFFKDRGVGLTKEEIQLITNYCLTHPKWTFVEVENADGTYIKIDL